MNYMFNRGDWILVEISEQEGKLRRQAFLRCILIIESTFLPLATKIVGKQGQKHNFSFWAGRMAVIRSSELALALLTSGERAGSQAGWQIVQEASWARTTKWARTNNPINMYRNEQTKDGLEASYTRWDLEINFKLQSTVEVGNSCQKHPCDLGSCHPGSQSAWTCCLCLGQRATLNSA